MIKIRLSVYIVILFSLARVDVYAQSSFNELSKVGQKLPQVSRLTIINYVKETVNFADFQGKPILLDFWAPWCAPCITLFPKLDSLQKKFQNNLHILPVTSDAKSYSERVFQNLKKSKKISVLPSIVADSFLTGYFNPRTIPHYVWVDGNGIIKAITGSEDVTESNIRKLIDGQDLSVSTKADTLFENLDYSEPFLTSGKLWTKDDLVAHSVLTKYIQGLSSNAGRGDNWEWIRCTRLSVLMLYKLAFGNFEMKFINDNRVILEGFYNEDDSLSIGRFTRSNEKVKWQEVQYKHLYNYELVIPKSNDTGMKAFLNNHKRLFDWMRQDLNRYFSSLGISAEVEKRQVKYLALVRTSASDKLKSRGGGINDVYSSNYLKIQNAPLSLFVNKLQGYFFKEDTLPIEDETKYIGRVDLELNCDLEDIDSVNRELTKYNLKLVKKERLMEMIVVTKQ